MKRKKGFRPIRFGPLFDDVKEALMPRVVSVLVVALFIVAIYALSQALIQRSDYFRLKAVDVKGDFPDRNALAGQLLKLHRGRNIYRVPLKLVAQSIRESYADARDIVVRVALPDKIVVMLKMRTPIAFVRAQRPVPIDEEGVMLMSGALSVARLPAIEGVVIRAEERRGRRFSSRAVHLAVDLLKEMKRSKIVRAYGVRSVEVSDLPGLSFTLGSGTVVKIGYENFRERLRILEQILKDPRLVLDKVAYIDVRFKDVAVGPKE